MRTPNPLPIITICIALLAIAALSLLLPTSSSANLLQGPPAAPLGATTVGGIISTNTTWTLAGSPYIVTSNVRVNSGVILTIEPGVEVRFDAGKVLQIDGTLIAQGTNSQRITFTANQNQPTAGAWQYINFTSTSVSAAFDSNGNYVNGSILRYCNVLYGGGGVPGAVHIQNTSPFIDRCQIRDGEGAGIYATNPPSLRISNNTITNNTRVGNFYQTNGGGIYVNGGGTTILTNTISNNNAYEGAGGINLINVSQATLVRGNIIMSNTANGGDAGVGGIRVTNNLAPVTISENTISNNTGISTYGGAGGGIKVFGNLEKVIIESNTINRNSAAYDEAGGGIDLGRHGQHAGGTAIIRNNEITKNDSHGIIVYGREEGAYDYMVVGTTEIIGNIISENIGDGIKLAAGEFTVTHNIIVSNGTLAIS